MFHPSPTASLPLASRFLLRPSHLGHHRRAALRLLRFHLQTPWLLTVLSPSRLADQSRYYYVSDTNGSSLGKVINFLHPPASRTCADYVQDFGFRKSELPHPRHKPSRGSQQVQTVNSYTSSFRSFIGPASAVFPIGSFHQVSSGTLDFSTRSLPKGRDRSLIG